MAWRISLAESSGLADSKIAACAATKGEDMDVPVQLHMVLCKPNPTKSMPSAVT